MTEEHLHPRAAEALFQEAVRFHDSHQLVEAAASYRRAAEMGHVLAQNNLGVLLLDKFQQSHVAEAMHWLEAAASAGEPSAAWNLACHYRDLGDMGRNHFWTARAAELGHDMI